MKRILALSLFLAFFLLLAVWVPSEFGLTPAALAQGPDMDPPETCGVPLRGPFGQDVEVLLKDYMYEPAGFNLSTVYPFDGLLWNSECNGGIARPKSSAAMAQGVLGTEQVVAVWKETCDAGHPSELYYSIWGASHDDGDGSPGGWGVKEGWLGQSPDGAPALLYTGCGADGWEVYARFSGKIEYRGATTDWENVPGVENAASDPVVVSSRPNHVALFYRDTDGVVWFTERMACGVWRDKPLPVTGGGGAGPIFLPIVVLRGAPAAAQAAGPEDSARISAASSLTFTLASELSAISRHENHMAVFGVDADGQLWANEWTSLNETDWSDTRWVKLMGDVKVEKPAVASRHSNHLAVAVRDETDTPHVIEWTAQGGWKVTLAGGIVSSAPLALAAISTDALIVFGADHSLGGVASANGYGWTDDRGWSGWQSQYWIPDTEVPISAAVRRPDDVMLLVVPQFNNNPGFYFHYTSQGRPLDASRLDGLSPPTGQQRHRNQVLAWVTHQTYYVVVDRSGDGTNWVVKAFDLDGNLQANLVLADHPYLDSPFSVVSVAAGDLDFDGDDEVVVATLVDPYSLRVSVLDPSVANPDTPDPTFTIERAAAVVVEPLGDTAEIDDLSLAIGDLDGDRVENEVVLAGTFGLSTGEYVPFPLFAHAIVYQFVPGEPPQLADKSGGFRQIKDWWRPWPGSYPTNHWELEVAIGKLTPQSSGEQLVVAYTEESGCEPANTGCIAMVGIVNIYEVLTPDGMDWSFQQAGGDLATREGDPIEFSGSDGNHYRSAVATGDLDADGYEEIAVWYLDRVYTIDPNVPEQSGNPAVKEAEVAPWVPPVPGQGGGDVGYAQLPRSLAVGDIDRDGRAEILGAASLRDENLQNPGFRFVLLEVMDAGNLVITALGPSQGPDWDDGNILVGDVDNDSFVSKLEGCATVKDVRVVTVINGAPRWYENGQPIHDSEGSYSVSQGGGSSSDTGTTYNLGASLTIGFETEVNVPIVATKVAEFRASVTQDFMHSWGISEARSRDEVYGTSYNFDEGLGLVVYTEVPHTCNYYEVYSPDAPQNVSKAMACVPGTLRKRYKSIEVWHSEAFKNQAGASWVDVGHHAPSGRLTNDLGEPDNYLPTLPVDEFMLVWHWDPDVYPIIVAPDMPGLSQTWWAERADGGARTRFTELEENTTVSVGSTVGGFSMDVSGTFGMGWQNSNTLSWTQSHAFQGGIRPFSVDEDRDPYQIVPFVYQATAKTGAGSTYPYWEMDYYVPCIGQCARAASQNP